ncbi:MAG TPA: ectoine/hydroxyectoine ABC transporter permease subunit EhuC [Thermoanaerobaculia bacterium]|nr:ectoine/hydroxyectoine ABC transporter permease subunit EhuC [Thermoanaerobaculia bacterium]
MTQLPPPLDLLPPLLDGLRLTLRLTLGGIALGTVFALAAGLARRARAAPVRALGAVYVETFRGTSALVQLFWFYFALPAIGIRLAAEPAGILVLALNAGAYGAEVVRGALEAVPRGQLEAASALGFSPRQTLWRIQLPQATLSMLPPAGNLAIELLKNTSLVSMITLSELTFQGQVLRAATLRTTEIFALLLAIYFVLAQALRAGVRALERHLGRGRVSASGA